MKTLRLNSRKITLISLLNMVVIITLLSTLTSCKDDDDEVNTIWGPYAVSETDEYDEVENYTITLTQSKLGGTNIEISNFGDFMYVPVKGSLDANEFTIPTQTFTAGNMTIEITGEGTLTGTKLNFNYTMKTGGDEFEYSCLATKK